MLKNKEIRVIKNIVRSNANDLTIRFEPTGIKSTPACLTRLSFSIGKGIWVSTDQQPGANREKPRE